MRLRTTRKLPGTRGEGELSNEGGGRNPGEEAKASLLGEGVTFPQRWKLEDGLPPLSREWAAAAALTLARRQDICLPETEEEGGGRKEGERGGLGGVDGEGKLDVYGGIGAGGGGGGRGSREADKEERRPLAVGGWPVKEEGKEVEEWEVFDPCKVGVQEGFMLSGLVQAEGMVLGRYGEEGGGEMSFGGEDEASWRGESAVRMDVVGRNTEEEEEGEGGCAMELSREGTTEGGEAGSGREEATRTLPSLQVKGTPEHKLVSGLTGAEDDGREGEAMGEGETDYDLAAARPLRFGGRASLSWRWGRRGSSMGIAEGGTEGKEGRRKRRLPMETSLVLSGAEMKAQMADTRDIMLERVRPRDRQRGVGREGGKKGEREVGLRMQAHALTGQLAEGLEGAIRKMMRPAPGFLLPIATREGWREAAREGGREEGAGSGRMQKRRREEREGCECEGRREEGGGGGAGDMEDGFRLGEKREAGTGFRQVGHDRKGGLPNDGPVLGVRTLYAWHGMLRGLFFPTYRTISTDDEDNGYSDLEMHFEGHAFQDPTPAEEGMEYGHGEGNELEAEEGGGEEEEEEKEEGEFTGTNAWGSPLGEEDDVAEAKPSTRWHPNTVRMCRLLRSRLAAAARLQEEVGGNGAGPFSPQVTFGELTRNARRTKAANMFWEILQLKTWDFIDCGQEEAYGEIIIEPAARLHEAIPGEGPKREA
jgi:hypothetical protein